MGRMLGSFADDNELDRPDLNKCPDCDCYFASDACPLCKKICPAEMRAGNRKPVKPKKQKRASCSGRVAFISWYHRWWFILLMLWFIPIVGIVLLVSSPHEKWKKWLVAGICIAWILLSSIGISSIISLFSGLFDRPVDTSLSREQYVAACAEISAEQYYRAYAEYENEFVQTTLIIVAKASYVDGQPDQTDLYYICTPVDNDGCYVIVRDCLIDSQAAFIVGDVITVYGEGDDFCRAYAVQSIYDGPCLNMAYAVLNE